MHHRVKIELRRCGFGGKRIAANFWVFFHLLEGFISSLFLFLLFAARLIRINIALQSYTYKGAWLINWWKVAFMGPPNLVHAVNCHILQGNMY